MSSSPSPASKSRITGLYLLLITLALLTLVSLPSVRFGSALWRLSTDKVIVIACFAASYIFCVVMLTWKDWSIPQGQLSATFGILAMGYAPTLLYLQLAHSDFPRSLILAKLFLGGVLLCATFLARRYKMFSTSILLLLAAIGVGLQVCYGVGILPRPPQSTTEVVVVHVNTSLYDLQVTQYKNWFPPSNVRGGGLTKLGDQYLLETSNGDLYLVSEKIVGQTLRVVQLPYHVPMNSDAFAAAAKGQVNINWFRAADVLAQEVNGRVRVYASHHFWKESDRCFVFRVSVLEGTIEDFLSGRIGMSWKTIFESSPCVPIVFPGRPPYFGGLQAGGRLALLNDKELLLSVGDNGLDGWNVPLSMPQDVTTSYGKTVLINLDDLSSQVYSIGHRNPQGLFADASGSIWLTEHGPQGGDELNLIERGGNYGSPIVTYGVEYGTHAWPFAPVPGSHDGYEQPYYSWTPAIGVSNLVVSDGQEFEYWKGDLLVSSLRGKAIFRMRIRDHRVVMVEQIPIGERIRDIEQGRGGEIWLWTDKAFLIVIRAAVGDETGAVLFNRCSGCHTIQNGYTHGFGPDLYRVVGRAVGSAEGFQYSAAMKSTGGTWTRGKLDAFLTDPQAVVPGTAMQFSGIPNAATRARILEYLALGEKRKQGQTIETPD